MKYEGVPDRITRILDVLCEGQDVLDIGCINHRMERANQKDWLHKYLYDIAESVTGIDILEQDVDSLREAGYNIKLANAESFDLNETYDVIIAGEIIEHLSCPGAMLDRCRDHLRPDGRLVITTPNPWNFVRLRRVFLNKYSTNPEHTCWFTPSPLRELLSRHGFVIKSLELSRPPKAGILDLLWKIGMKHIGGTNYVAVAELSDSVPCDGL